MQNQGVSRAGSFLGSVPALLSASGGFQPPFLFLVLQLHDPHPCLCGHMTFFLCVCVYVYVFSQYLPSGWFPSFPTVLSSLSLKEVRVDVLTCHNTAFLDIQQKRPTAGRFSFPAVAEECLKVAC